MSLLGKLKSLVADPPPEFVFELSAAGIAWRRSGDAQVHWTPLAEGVVAVSPTENNVLQPDEFAAAVRSIVPASEKRNRRAALILPDFSARVAVVDFDTFPSDPAEQVQLARFRAKRVVPFDIDSATVACYPQTRHDASKKVDVVVAVVNLEVASHFEAPFRAAGLQCGFVTLSALSALALRPSDTDRSASPAVVVKWSGPVVALSLIQNGSLRLFRCLELRGNPWEESTDLLATTFAYAEDELGARPKALRVCGLGREDGGLRHRWTEEFGLPVGGFESMLGTPGEFNAGLLGYLESREGN